MGFSGSLLIRSEDGVLADVLHSNCFELKVLESVSCDTSVNDVCRVYLPSILHPLGMGKGIGGGAKYKCMKCKEK